MFFSVNCLTSYYFIYSRFMDEISHIVPIAHVLPITLCSDGEIRVLLGEKRVGERIDEILLQPF